MNYVLFDKNLIVIFITDFDKLICKLGHVSPSSHHGTTFSHTLVHAFAHMGTHRNNINRNSKTDETRKKNTMKGNGTYSTVFYLEMTFKLRAGSS